MKILEKFVLILYSLLILAISVIICLIIFNVINIEQIKFCIDYVIKDTALTITVLAISVVCILLSVRCIFFRKKKQIKKSTNTDILLENETGRLLISKNAIENAVKNIVRESMKNSTDVKVTVDIDPAENLSVYISVMLDRALNVRDLTLDLQLKVKDEIKQNFGLDVKQVNIKVDSDEKEIEKLEKNNKKESAKLVDSTSNSSNVIEIKQDDNNFGGNING